MNPRPDSAAPRRRGFHRPAALLLALPVALGVLAPMPAQAKPHRDVTVLTQNLYLGASLDPALRAETPQEFLAAVADIYATVQTTDYPRRSEALAARIAKRKPDLIGLQEVTRWSAVDPSAGRAELDFLDILLEDLAEEGMSYSVQAVSENATIGPVPLLAPCTNPEPDCTVSFQDRDVILVNDATPGLQVLRRKSGTFENQVSIPTPFGTTLSFDRGWAWIVARYRGKKFRFINTHLETQAAPATQRAQADELLAGPARPRGRKILVGDFNSAADGSTTSSYGALTERYRDAWSTGVGDGFTCCQRSMLGNEESRLTTRIDLILTRGAIAPLKARVFAKAPIQAEAPRWISDHAGVFAKVRLR